VRPRAEAADSDGGDEFTRESDETYGDDSIPAAKGIEVLAFRFFLQGVPEDLRRDNGPEFLAAALQDGWAKQAIPTASMEPGQPWQKGVQESFHGRGRDEGRNLELFYGLSDARWTRENDRRSFHEERRQGALGDVPPIEFQPRGPANAPVASLQSPLLGPTIPG
jgi:putative transposase